MSRLPYTCSALLMPPIVTAGFFGPGPDDDDDADDDACLRDGVAMLRCWRGRGEAGQGAGNRAPGNQS